MAEYIDFPAKLRSTRRDRKLVDASAIDGVLPQSQIGLDGIEQEVEELRHVTHDLHAGEVPSGWAAVNADGSEGGIAVIDGTDPLAEARAVSAWSVTLDENLAGEALVVRLPHGADIGSYRADIAAIGGGDYYDDLTRYLLIGSDNADNATWDYHYYGAAIGTSVSRITLQTPASEAAGTSTYSGNLVLAKVLEALGVDSVSDLGGGGVDEVRDDLSKLHAYIAEHLTDISDEVADPTQDDSPAHYYLTQKARHTIRDVSVPFESGLYELTTGPASACRFTMARVGTGTDQIHGFVSRSAEGLENQGSVLHNPLSAIAAFYMYQDPDDNNYFLAALLKRGVYDVLRKQHALANTAIYFKVTDGTTAHEFEMGAFQTRHIAGIEYYLMRDHLIDATAQARWTGYFTSGNGFAPTLTVTFNQSSAQSARSDSPLSYLGTTETTKAYTFRENGFARLVGLETQLDQIPEHTQEIAALEAKVALLMQVNETGIASLTSPTATHSITEATTWTARGQRDHFYTHVLHDVGLDNSLIELTWENMEVLDGWDDFDEEGATNASGSMWFHGRDLDSFFAANHIANTTGNGRATVNGALQEIGRMEVSMLAANDDLEIAVDFFEHSVRTDNNPGRMPANFALTIRAWNPS